MNIVQLENYRQKLFQLKLNLLTDGKAEGVAAVELNPQQFDDLSFQQRIKMQETAKNKLAQLQAIEGALRRIDTDDFGFCYICDQAITEARLNFDLTVTRCLQCEGKAFD